MPDHECPSASGFSASQDAERRLASVLGGIDPATLHTPADLSSRRVRGLNFLSFRNRQATRWAPMLFGPVGEVQLDGVGGGSVARWGDFELVR